ncbi:MAG TPA: DUF202 domain-containing protein [Acidimicrobiales bacterium]
MDGNGRLDDDEEGDPGLARERTDLAWNRSGLAVAVTIAIILRRLWPLSGDRAVLVLALIAAGATLWVVAMRLGRRVRNGSGGALGDATCRALTAGTLILGVGAFIVTFV